jgi:hypothetical protein
MVAVAPGAIVALVRVRNECAAKGAVVVTTDPVLSYQGRLIWRSGPLSPAAERFVALTRDYFSEAPPRRTAKTP